MAAKEGNSANQNSGRYFVYLRIKPADITQVTDVVTGLEVNKDSVTVSSAAKRDEIQKDSFKFTTVFLPSSSQRNIFDTVAYPRLEDFMNGEDSLIFSYGTTNSGKSFSMQGTPSHPGIIPRALRAIFFNIQDAVDTDLPLRPHKNKDAVVLSAKVRQQVMKAKKDLLISVAGTNRDGNPNASISATSPHDMQFEDDVPALQIPYTDCRVGVWVSFYEIYNEVLNDLLSASETPTTLNVVKDPEDDSFYPEGLIHIPVSSWEEAFDVYRAGKKKLQVSSTLMNRQSSRSHCVFCIKLLMRPTEDSSSFYDLSSLSFCDLAGNERVSHLEGPSVTNAGKKETLKINSSLLALNKCFVMLKSNLGRATATMPSFRDSKLTMVFKKFLARRGKLSMLANISQDPEMLASTLHILKMTAIAVDTRVHVPKPELVNRCRRRFSIAHGPSTGTPASRLQTVPEATPIVNPVQIDQSEVDSLRAEVAAKDRDINALTNELASTRAYCQELEAEIERLQEREQLDAAFSVRRDNYTRELEEKQRAYHKKELQMLSRLHNTEQTYEDLFEQLAEGFSLQISTDHRRIVDNVIHNHKSAVRLALEEIQELADDNAALRIQLDGSTLRQTTLKGELIQAQSELELEREMSESLRAQNEELRKQLEGLTTDASSGPVENQSVSGYDATAEEGHFSSRPVRVHRSLRWLSDEEDSPRVPPRPAATTGRKRRVNKKKKNVPQDEADAEPAPRRATRRRLQLLPRAAGNVHLDANVSSLDLSVDELQPSPNTFMRTARNQKK